MRDPTVTDTGARALARRVASAVILMPIALAAIYSGALWFALIVAGAAALMAWEWVTMTRVPLRKRQAALVAAALAALAVLIAAVFSMALGLAVAMSLPILVLALEARIGRSQSLWLVAGCWWIVLPAIGIVWLRDAPDNGLRTILWLVCLVWAVDIAAYAGGRTFGGPKLAPRISPKKTWSGLSAGVLAACVVGCVTALLTPSAHWWQILLLSAVLGVIEQAGDMAESYAKRHFGVKDSGSLIPGHGGLLDRLDGMLAVAAVVSLLTLMTGDLLIR